MSSSTRLITAWATVALAQCLQMAVHAAEPPVLLEVPIPQPVAAWAVNQPPLNASAGMAGIRVRYARAGGEGEVFLPVVADTFLGGDTVWGGKDFVVMRKDSQKHDILMRLDMTELPADAEVREAEFLFHYSRPRTLQFNKSIQPFRLTFHAIDVAWEEDATSAKPSAAGAATWAQPVVGRGFAAEPFAEIAGDDAAVDEKKTATVPGLGPLVAEWRTGKRPNNGFAVVVHGPVNAVALRSREALLAAARPPLLGGASGAGVVLPLPVEALRALTPDSDWLMGISLGVQVRRISRTPQPQAELRVHRVKQAVPGASRLEATAVEAQLLATFSLAAVSGGRHTNIVVELPVAVLRAALDGRAPCPALYVTVSGVEGDADAFDAVLPAARREHLVARIARVEERLTLPRETAPTAGVYVENRKGNLYYGGQRLRLWGMIAPQRPNLEMLARARDTGFNAIRLWGPRHKVYPQPNTNGVWRDSATPDGADIDQYDRFFAEAKRQGMFVMSTGLMGTAPANAESTWLRDVGDPAEWEAWTQAVDPPVEGWLFPFFAAFDERVFAARQAIIRNYLTHRNPYTGRTYAEDEAIAIFELDNEGAHIKRILERGVEKWPAFFREKLTRRWNVWLAARYGNDDTLRTAWGSLGVNENTVAGTIAFAPTFAQRTAYSARRAEDVVRFLTDLEVTMCRRIEAYSRTFAPAGVGVNVVPFSYDNQYQPCTPWSYAISQGDVANFGMYFWHMTSSLTAPPSLYVMDAYTVQDKVTVIYETMAARPNPVRAEYAYKMAAFAGRQDWDAIFFHYYMGLLDEKRTFAPEDYLVRPMTYIDPKHFWSGTYYDQDPVLISSLMAAGRIFLSGAVASAPAPATFVLGGRGIFAAERFGWLMPGQAAFSHGSRLRYEPEGDFDLRIENAAESDFALPPTAAVGADDVIWDWPNGRLLIDTPTGKAYVGKPNGTYRFRNGLAVGGFEGDFVAFGLQSLDGKPLVESTNILVSAVRDARNHGAVLNLSNLPPDGKFMAPLEMGSRVQAAGTAPVDLDRVPFTLWFPNKMSGRLERYDFAGRRVGDEAVAGGSVAYDGRPQFALRLIVTSRGAVCETPATERPVASATVGGDADVETTLPPVADPALWTPYPGFAWNDSPALAARRFRALAVRAGWKVGFVRDEAAGTAYVEGTDAIFGALGSLRFDGSAQGLERVELVFAAPPPLERVLQAYTKELGPPVADERSPTADKPSTVRWCAGPPRGPVTVEVLEVQGVMTLQFSRK